MDKDKRQRRVRAFWSKVDKSSNCWTWTACTTNGYGQSRFGSKTYRSHKLAWILENGSVPDGLHVCHKCDNPLCVRPSHLFLGTNAVNIADKVTKQRHSRGQSHGMAKLDDLCVRLIREIYAGGAFQQKALAKFFGVSKSAISAIVLGHKWKHLPASE